MFDWILTLVQRKHGLVKLISTIKYIDYTVILAC